MTPEEAYSIVKEKLGSGWKAVQCKDFGQFYGFFLAPAVQKNPPFFVGGLMMAVDKSSKKTFEYDFSTAQEEFRNAKTVPFNNVSKDGKTTVSFLSHHGIKDQKWGVRRFQNPDGSLTALGRLRYGVGKERGGAGEEDGPKTDGHSGGEQKKAAALKSVKKEAKSARQMDEDELLKRIGRLEREKRYSDLVVEQKKRETGTMERLLKEAGTDFLKQSLSKVVSKTVARIFDKNEGDFKIEKYQDKDTGKLDLGTLQKIKKWYETAGDVENKRDAYNHRGAPDDKNDFSRLSAKSLNTVKEWYESARAAEKARDSYEHRNDPPKEKKKKEQ